MKQKKTYRLSEFAVNYIENYANEHSINTTQALEDILYEHNLNNQSQTDIIADAVINKFKEKYENIFTRIRLGTNTADKNSQILIELMNTILLEKGIEHYCPTRKIKSVVLSEAESNVSEYITSCITKGLEKKSNHKTGTDFLFSKASTSLKT